MFQRGSVQEILEGIAQAEPHRGSLLLGPPLARPRRPRLVLAHLLLGHGVEVLHLVLAQRVPVLAPGPQLGPGLGGTLPVGAHQAGQHLSQRPGAGNQHLTELSCL